MKDKKKRQALDERLDEIQKFLRMHYDTSKPLEKQSIAVIRAFRLKEKTIAQMKKLEKQ